jgi:hypothetical protein
MDALLGVLLGRFLLACGEGAGMDALLGILLGRPFLAGGEAAAMLTVRASCSGVVSSPTAKVPRGWMNSSAAVTGVGTSAAGTVPVVVVVMIVWCVSVSFMVPFPDPR